MELMLVGLMVGVDNLRASLAIGALDVPRRRRLELLGAFGVVEGTMPLLGVALGASRAGGFEARSDLIGAGALAVAGLVVLVGAVRGRDAAAWLGNRGALWLLPSTLAMDNLLAGFGLGALGIPLVPAAVTVGAISAVLAGVGLAAGVGLRRVLATRAPVAAGLALIAGAMITLAM